MLDLEKDRKKRQSWARVKTENGRIEAHSFLAYSVFSDVMLHAVAAMAVLSPFLGLLPSLFPDAIQEQGQGLSPMLSWAISGLLACSGAGLLYGHRAAPVEHFLTFDPLTNTLETTAFNRNGARISHATIRIADIETMFLVDDEGARHEKRTHPSTDVWLRVVSGRKKLTLLSGREEDIWPVYQRMFEMLPHVAR